MSTQLEAVLAPLVNALEADGYGAVIEETPGLVSFQIVAGPDACEECLSPPQVMTGHHRERSPAEWLPGGAAAEVPRRPRDASRVSRQQPVEHGPGHGLAIN